MIEANPRASRTVPFVSKAIGLPLAKLACRIMLGERIADLDLPDEPTQRPRLRQGGGAAVRPLRRRRLAARARDALDRRGDGHRRATSRPRSPRRRPRPARGCPTRARCSSPSPTPTSRPRPGSRPSSTTSASRSSPPAAPRRRSADGRAREAINKIGEGSPHVVDRIERGAVDLVINTPVGTGARADGYEIRSAAVARGIPCITTMAGGDGGGAGDRRRAARGARGGLAAGDPPRTAGSSPAATMTSTRAQRVTAPFGARVATVIAPRAARRLRRARCADPAGPRPQAGPVLHAVRGRSAGAEEPASGRSCRARSASCGSQPPPGARRSLQFLIEDVGPGTNRLCELGAGRGALARRAARQRLRRAARRSRGALLVGGGIGIAPLASGRTSSATGATVLLGFRDAGTPRGARAARRCRRSRTDDGSAGHHGLVTELLDDELDGDDARRGLRVRPAGDARGGAAAVRGARDPGSAGARVRDGVRLRRLLRLRRARPATGYVRAVPRRAGARGRRARARGVRTPRLGH